LNRRRRRRRRDFKRPPLTIYTCSLLQMHNETVNIWTHIFGFMLFAALLPITVAQLDNATERVIFLLYIVPCIELFGASACYHLFKDQSERAGKLWQKLDHLSIIFLLWGSDMPMICYGFWSFPTLQMLYVAAVTMLVICVALIIRGDEMQTPHLHMLRRAVLVGTCAVGWMQLVHEMSLKGWSSSNALRALACWAKAFGIYLLGFAFFVSRVPEALFPVKFDLIVSRICSSQREPPTIHSPRFLLRMAGCVASDLACPSCACCDGPRRQLLGVPLHRAEHHTKLMHSQSSNFQTEWSSMSSKVFWKHKSKPLIPNVYTLHISFSQQQALE